MIVMLLRVSRCLGSDCSKASWASRYSRYLRWASIRASSLILRIVNPFR
nr:MAG TPA: hypothetical protein [Caudoviricetes sp.]